MTQAVSRRLLSWPFPFSVAMATERIVQARAAAFAGAMVPCIIERRVDGGFLGWISVTRESTAEHTALLSYWLGGTHHGLGYMKEAAAAAIAASFALLDLNHIRAEAQCENTLSHSVLEACGMVYAGETMRFAPARGRDEPSVVYTLARPAASGPVAWMEHRHEEGRR